MYRLILFLLLFELLWLVFLHKGEKGISGIIVFSNFFLSRFSSFSRLCPTLFTAFDIFPISPICSCSLNHLFPTVVFSLTHQLNTCFSFFQFRSSFSSCFSISKALRPILINSRIRGLTPLTISQCGLLLILRLSFLHYYIVTPLHF